MTISSQPARRRERNPDRTRRKVLDAARAEFAEKGLNGARTDAIARAAGSNIQALYHYFGGKEALYVAVLTDMFSEDWLFSEWRNPSELDVDEAIRLLLKCIARKYSRDRQFAALITDQNTHKARHLKQIAEFYDFYSRVIAELAAVLARGQAMGRFRKDVDAPLFYMAAVSAIGGSATGMFTYSEALGREAPDARRMEQWAEEISALLLRGLRPD